MNIVLPVDFQSFVPAQQTTGTADARADNASKPIIEPPQTPSNAQHAKQQGAGHQTGKDKVSLSEEGKNAAKSEQSSSLELSEEDKKEVQSLEDRDREVRTHEQAHAAVGGQYAGSPSYDYETGPDGQRYAVGGEVSIDVSEEKDPGDTVQKMQVVRAAALAPAEPSSQDLKVAAEASQKEQQARAEMTQQDIDEKKSGGSNVNQDNTLGASKVENKQQLKFAQMYSDISQEIRPSSLSITV